VEKVSAMPIGTLLYRTSSNGQLYGLNQKELMTSKNGIMEHIYSGHTAIYVGKINGKDYIVEALAGGLQKTEAKYFIDESQGEKFLGAMIPKEASDLQRQMAVEIALALSEYHFSYDFDFHKQKGPRDGEWTCVGLTEKVYESADIRNPYNFSKLSYDNSYAVDITPDGYDDYSTYNSRGDTFSRSKEFSKINSYTNTILPAPEILGYNIGRQYKGDRYFFFPYTQFLQNSLKEVELDIDIGSENTFSIRPGYKSLPLVLKYTFINQPLSLFKKIGSYISDQKAVAYSADDNSYDMEVRDKESGKKESAKEELLSLSREEINTNTKLVTQDTLINSNNRDELNNLNDNKDNKKSVSEELQKNTDYIVKDIISADTFVLENDIQVTLASISLPKLADKIWQRDECKAKASINLVQRLLTNNEVRLMYSDRTSFDSSSRLLAYVYYKDKEVNDYKLLNNELIKLGLGDILNCNEAIYCDPYIHSKIEESSKYAKNNKLGIFSSTCEKENEGTVNRLSSLGKNLFKGISLKTNKIINNLGQVIKKPIDNTSNEDTSFSKSVENNNNSTINENDEITGSEEYNSSQEDASVDNNDTSRCIDKLLISAVYSTKQNDWIELYNNCDEDIDLAEVGVRLEKAVSTDNPGIIIRFNQMDDFSASNTIIKAHDTYIISRAEAVLNFNVDAVSLRDNFNLGDSGYSIYLANGPVSDLYDEDIIDLLGYGSSNYFRGTRPAVAIDDYYVLRRKADISSNTFNLYPQHNYSFNSIYNSGHNFQDYILLDTGLGYVEDEDESLGDDGDDDRNDDNNQDDGNDGDDNTGDNTNDDEVEDSNDEEEYNICIDELLISAVYTTAQDDYIEIFNNCDQSIDLVEAGIRLEKAISSEDPDILIRFNETTDYVAANTIIQPYSSYTISRQDANINFEPDAISQRNNFALSGDAYSIYLAKGPVSDPYDEDIIDLLGYGLANYYLGTGPASFIDDYNLLRRRVEMNSSASTLDIFHDYNLGGIYNSDDNFFDFIAISTDWNEADEDEFEGGDNEEDDNNVNIVSLWHLDTCFGDYIYNELNENYIYQNWQWSARPSSCVLKVNNREDILELPFSNDIDPNNMTILWDYQFENEYSRMNIELVTMEGDNLILTLSPYYIEITKPGHSKVRYDDYSLPLDNNWHRLALTTNISDSSLNIYLDNTILTTINLGQRLYELSSFKFMSDYVSSYLQIDEIAIFDKPVDEDYLNLLGDKISPYQPYNFVGSLDLKHSWNFIEGQGSIAYDTISSYNLNIDQAYWSNGINDYGVKLNELNNAVFSELLIDDNRKSFSLGFWYRNSAYPEEGRGRIMLKQGTNTKIGLKFTPYNSYLYYNHKEIPLSSYNAFIEHDDNWHYFVLTYDASNYSLKFYLDGMELYSDYKPWLDRSFDYMEIIQENWEFQLDEIKIYEGSLSEQLIYDTYQQKYY